MNKQEYFNEMLGAEDLQDYVTEKIASFGFTESEFHAFLDDINEIDKVAGIADYKGILAGAALAAVPATYFGSKMINNHQHKMVLEKVMQAKPELRQNKKRTIDHFSVLTDLAPTIAKNPVIAASLLEQLGQYDVIDQQTISKLIDSEKNLQQSRGGGAGDMISAGASLVKGVKDFGMIGV